jgi:hypothetical protein
MALSESGSGTPAMLQMSTATVDNDTTNRIDAVATPSRQAVEPLAPADFAQYFNVPSPNQTSNSVTAQENHTRPTETLATFLDEYDDFDNYFQVVDAFHDRNSTESNTLALHHLRREHDSTLDDFGLLARARKETNPVSDPHFSKHVFINLSLFAYVTSWLRFIMCGPGGADTQYIVHVER